MAERRIIKALSLTQPWATLVAIGQKRVETRSWKTHYRGPLVIHASKGFPQAARTFAAEERTIGRLPARLPLGAIIATATLVNVERTEEIDYSVSAIERYLGDFSMGRFAWTLTDIQPLTEPIPAKGSLGLWNWEPPAEFRLTEAPDG